MHWPYAVDRNLPRNGGWTPESWGAKTSKWQTCRLCTCRLCGDSPIIATSSTMSTIHQTMSIQFIDDVFKVKQYCYHKEEEMCQCLCFCRFIMIHPHLCMVGLVAALVTRHRPCLGASDAGSAELTSTGLPLGQAMSSHRSCTWGMSLLHLAIAMQLEHLKKICGALDFNAQTW